MAIGDLTRDELNELLALSKLQGGPGCVVEKSQLRCLVDEVIRRRDYVKHKITKRQRRLKAKGPPKGALKL